MALPHKGASIHFSSMAEEGLWLGQGTMFSSFECFSYSLKHRSVSNSFCQAEAGRLELTSGSSLLICRLSLEGGLILIKSNLPPPINVVVLDRAAPSIWLGYLGLYCKLCLKRKPLRGTEDCPFLSKID